MNIKVIRETYSKDSTIGKMYIDGQFFCYTLEDAVREKKIKNVTAIPAGVYKVIINYSNRFKQLMPLLLNVPNYAGVRIHWGNYSKDTEGCLLVGNSKGVDMVGNSKACYASLMAKLKQKMNVSKIQIEIIDTKPVKPEETK